MVRWYVLISLGISLVASAAPTWIPLAQPFSLLIGQKASLDSGNLTVRVLGIQDSRCPKGVTCIVAGEAKVRLGLSEKGKSLGALELTLSAAPDPKNTGHLGSYYLRLLDVQPYPNANTVSKPARTVRLEVQKTPFK
ncbi:MAG: hypothetical protein C4332_11930 [Meiothermus sp.]